MFIGRGSSEIIEIDIEIFINLGMDFIVMVTNLLGSFFGEECFDFGCCSVFIGPANIHAIITH